MDIDVDMAASSRPRNGLAEKLAAHCPECLRPLGNCTCDTPCAWPECDCPSRSCGGPAVYTMREPGPFEIPDYRDLPPGAKVLTVGIGDMLYLPPERATVESEGGPLLPLFLLTVAFILGVAAGYFAGGLS